MKPSSLLTRFLVLATVVLLPIPRLEASSYCPGCEAGIVAAGAAIGGGIAAILLVHHSHTTVAGCVLDNGAGLGLTTDDGKTYKLMNAPPELREHRRVQLHGHKKKAASGRLFEVSRVSHEYGECK